LIGNIFRQNHPHKEYILRKIEANGQIDAIDFFTEANRDFYAELHNSPSHMEKIYIITNQISFTLVGKLLCTLTDDKLVLKNQILIPSKCEQFTQESFTLEVKDTIVNVIEVQESQILPELFLDDAASKQKLHFFERSIKEVIDLLNPLARQFNVELNFSQRVNQWIEVEVECNTYGSISKFIEITKQRHADNVIVADDLVQHIIDALLATDQKITLAESCTGGLLAYYFTSHAGVSSVFEGSLVTYSNILKENWLAVENSPLVDNGAVSEAVVSEMCEGGLAIANDDYAIDVSGFAGPEGGGEAKTRGTGGFGL